MNKELARSARALGRDLNFFGSKEKDFVIQTKGRVKINFGDKFIELFNGSKFTTGNNDAIKTVHGKPNDKDQDGFYFDEDTGTLYLKIGDKIYEIFTGATDINGFISYKDKQSLTGKEQILAKENIGSIFNTPEEAKNSGSEGVVFINSENKAYILKGGVLYPITNNTEIVIGDDENNYFFDKTVTIGVSDEDLALIIEGLEKKIQIGTEDNNTIIYQTDKGGVIDSDHSLTIKINNKNSIVIKDGEVDFNSIINAIKGIITDEIYSSNFELNNSGWGIWIDKSTGESYLQVDNIIGNVEITPIFTTYQEAVILAKKGLVKTGAHYVMLDYQNEWECTSVEEYIGKGIALNDEWDPQKDSIDPSKYEEDEFEPKFDVDRNVRPLCLIGKNSNAFEDKASYFYLEDGKDIIEMFYDLRMQNYDESWVEEEDSVLDMPNKGRIYYMKDTYNNEAPLDFKHYQKDGKFVFNSPNNDDLSSLNTEDSIVCVNNIIKDLNTRIVDELDSIIITGTKIVGNEFIGKFENCILGDSKSEIENNIFRGESKDTDFIGTFKNNDFKSNIENCKFKKQVIGNVWNKPIKDSEFSGIVENNTFNVEISESKFLEDCISNQIMGSIFTCEFQKKVSENQLTGDFKECIWKDRVYGNMYSVGSTSKCTWEKLFFSNQITADKWEDNIFKDTVKYNIFQADVVKFTVEGLLNNNQFIGRINDVSFIKDGSNKAYGLNNNIINGTFDTSRIGVDFSHNTITGPIYKLDITPGETEAIDKTSQFNYNDIKASSIWEITINADFRRNNIKAQVWNTHTFNKPFTGNTLNYDYYHTNSTFNKMIGCNGSGLKFGGTFAADFIECNFGSISNCTFREVEIKNACFRSSFTGANFDSDNTIKDLELLYDEKHQVDVFKHDGKNWVSCQACADPLKGEIRMYNGLVSDIPEGWHICDGTEGTPNLIDHFIAGGLEVKEQEGVDLNELKEGILLETKYLPTDEIETNEDGLHSHSYQAAGSMYSDNADDRVVGTPGFSSQTSEDGEHTHKIQLNEGEQEKLKVLPNYYYLIFIMKL